MVQVSPQHVPPLTLGFVAVLLFGLIGLAALNHHIDV